MESKCARLRLVIEESARRVSRSLFAHGGTRVSRDIFARDWDSSFETLSPRQHVTLLGTAKLGEGLRREPGIDA